MSFSRPEAAILAAGLWVYVFTLFVPHSFHYSYDGGAHLAHIRFLTDHGRPPLPDQCYECHQPTLYYAMSAIAFEAGRGLGMGSPVMAVRWLGIVLYLGFIAFGRKLLRDVITSPSAYLIALALLVFWPSGIGKAGAVGNDIAEALAQLACFYYLLRWWRLPQAQSLAMALLWNGLAIAIKHNGVILCPIIAITVALRWLWQAFPWQRLAKNRQVVFSCLAIAMIAVLTIGRSYFYYRIEDPAHHRPLLNPKIRLVDYHMQLPDDGPRYYASFDIEGFFAQPFFNPRGPATDRSYFWNSLLKSALYGEFFFRTRSLATALDALELAMLAYMGMTATLAWRRGQCDPLLIPFAVFLEWQIGMLIIARALYPTANNGDFRFIYASVAVMALLYGKALLWHEKQHHRLGVWIGRSLGVLFVAAALSLMVWQDAQDWHWAS